MTAWPSPLAICSSASLTAACGAGITVDVKAGIGLAAIGRDGCRLTGSQLDIGYKGFVDVVIAHSLLPESLPLGFFRQSIVSETLFGLYSLGTGYWLEIKQRPPVLNLSDRGIVPVDLSGGSF